VEALKKKIIMLVECEIREAHAIALFRHEQVMFQEDLERVILKNIQEHGIPPQLELNALVDEIANRIEATREFQKLPCEFLDWADLVRLN
jgi:hypothetical protein